MTKVSFYSLHRIGGKLTRKPEIADKLRQIQTCAAYLRWVEDFSKAKAEVAA